MFNVILKKTSTILALMLALIMLISMHDGDNLLISGNPDANDADLQLNLSNPAMFGATPAKMPTSGVYWTTFTNIPDSAYEIAGMTFGVGCYLNSASICEPSTGQILADMREFPDSVDCMTCKSSHDGVQYWLERTQDSNGKTASIKVASTGANIPYLNLTMFGRKLNYPELHIWGLKADGGVVHTPEGAVLSDPYSDPSLRFGGVKELHFKAEKIEKGFAAQRIVEEAGYQVSSLAYGNEIFRLDVGKTSIGRAKIEKDVLEKHHWFPVKGETRGNHGLYEFRDTVIFNIESQSQGETVKNQKIKLKGTITNRASEFDPVTSMKVFNTSGTERDTVDATITSDSTFTADVNLFAGLNMLVLMPKHETSEGKEVYLSKYIVKVQGNQADALQLTYDAEWKSRIVLTKRIKTTRPEPDPLIENSMIQISANLKIDFNSSKLWYIKKSLENAKSCAEFDDCSLFSGGNDGAVKVAEKRTQKTKDCDGELPLITRVKSDGYGFLDKYRLYITASLIPWAENDNSPQRRYQLCITGGPEISIHSSKDWPTSRHQVYDCSEKKWIPSSNKIGPVINLDKEKALLKFPVGKELEAYTESPVTSKTWTFSASEEHEDGNGATVTEYTVTLTIHP